MSDDQKTTEAPQLEEVYPELSDEELQVARENLKRYLTTAMRIYERKQTNSPTKKTDT